MVSKLTSPPAQQEAKKKKPSATAKLLTGNALAAPTCPTLPPAKQGKILTGAKPPAVSHDHQSRSQMLFAITAYSHEDAKRPRVGVPEWYPSTQGTTETQRGQNPPGTSPATSQFCLCSRALAQAEPAAEPGPQPKGKAFHGSSQTFFASSERGCSPRRCHCLILSGAAGKGGEHRRTQLPPARHGTASPETCRCAYRCHGVGGNIS